MLKRSLVLALLAAAVVVLPSCTKPTKITGTLKLQAGQTGDVQNTRVELYEHGDLTGDPVMYVASKASGSANSSDFEFTDVIEGYYYILAWKDMDNDGAVSDGDIVGVYGGTYHPGYGGERVIANKGQTTAVGDITMLLFQELEITAAGARSNGNAETDFTYVFNHDVTLTSLTITFPTYGASTDQNAPGAKTAGVTYHSDGWNVGGGAMPTGDHTLEFVGSWDGAAFDVIVHVTVS